MQQAAEDKVGFYQTLDRLDGDDEDNSSLDEGYAESARLLAPPPRILTSTPPVTHATPTGLADPAFLPPPSLEADQAANQEKASTRSPAPFPVSTFTTTSSGRSGNYPSHVEGARPGADLPDPPLRPEDQAQATSAMTTRGTASKATGKRKRSADVVLVPEARRLFNGLTFYFCPNNDRDMARRLKIQKAIQYGATWQKDWDSRVTHVVADDRVTYADLLKSINLSELPPDVIAVTQRYQDECLQLGRLLDPNHRRYHLKGYDVVREPSKPAPPSPETQDSLLLKPSRTKPAETPPQPALADQQNSSHDDPAVNSGKRSPPVRPDTSLAPAYNDELAEAINETKEFAHLPLDCEYEEDKDSDANDVSDTTSEDERPRKAPKASAAGAGSSWQQNFQCMQKHDGLSDKESPNARTIEILEQMNNYYERIQDTWRTLAYRKAISTLRKQPVKISTKEQAACLPFVGTRLAEKIEEIVCTDRLKKLENALLSPEDETLQLYLGIYGVGLQQASKWISQGFRTLDDLSQRANLSANQKVGIAHYHDFKERIPRAEVEQHGETVRKAVQEVDPAFEVVIMGSFRRGAPTSGDIDLIVTKRDASLDHLRSVFIDQVVPKLFSQGFLKADLASSRRVDGSKWHGACALQNNSVWRRIDFLLVPSEEMGAALIYFTGNDIFNRSMRLLASKKGMRLNQHGLYKDCMRGRQREKITEGTLIEGRNEEKIFEILGVPWRPPHHRLP